MWLRPWWLEDRAHDVHPQHADATRQLRGLVVLLLLRHGQVRHGLTALPLRAHAPAVQRRQLELDAYLGRRGFTMSRETIKRLPGLLLLLLFWAKSGSAACVCHCMRQSNTWSIAIGHHTNVIV